MRAVTFAKRSPVIVAAVCIMLFAACGSLPIEARQIKVVFRFDDYSACSPTDIELRIIEAFRQRGASITFGVIPFVCAGDIHDPSPMAIVPLTSEKAAILRTGFKDGILDVAVHGYSHQTNNAKQWSEFSGLDYQRQVERLDKGKKLLEGVIDAPVTTFVPPWNRYDLNTLRALEQLGFSTLSADEKGEVAEDSKLNFLPASCGLSQLRGAIEAARGFSDNQPVIVALFHAYDFREIDKKRGNTTFHEFCDLLDWLKSQRDIRLLSISQTTKVIRDQGANRFLSAKRHPTFYGFSPPSIQLNAHHVGP
jgi:peptidoglycan/xylan/chitin deacetylase (PgdA/CDA1 family)